MIANAAGSDASVSVSGIMPDVRKSESNAVVEEGEDNERASKGCPLRKAVRATSGAGEEESGGRVHL